MIQLNHHRRQINRGRAQWRVEGVTAAGLALTVVYDHPHGVDAGAARIVSAWSR
jgi:hypothetical protein